MMRRMKFTLGAVAAIALSTAAMASEVAPDAVEFTDDGVTMSLTGVPGDPVAGADTFKSKTLGNCLACHVNASMPKEQFHGDVGPALDGVASRWDEPQLRAILVNSKKALSEETLMPGFYSLEVGKDVAEKFVGKTILTAQQVEDVLAYISTLKE